MYPPMTSGVAAEAVFVVGSGIPLRFGVRHRFGESIGRKVAFQCRRKIDVREQGATGWIERGRTPIVRRSGTAKHHQQNAEPARAHAEIPDFLWEDRLHYASYALNRCFDTRFFGKFQPLRVDPRRDSARAGFS